MVAAIIGAILWAVIAMLTGYRFSYAAIGLGCLVGLAVRLLGKGSELRFRIAGALLSLFGCFLGNIFIIYALLAKEWDVSFFQIMGTVSISETLLYLRLTFNLKDVLFYGLALLAGLRMAASDY
ncbi:hypothetical protein [Acetivibrio straminisolvens]|uniref:Uncharacterized protein n=2 Tax=Acetivibrio straminisolvens TaxID=253314 RepID=W4V6T3_9FIRM|nr:hypothetical protein [Acetivibrio straminisolvens]GAE88434.1 hypothetical protein JCM21531_1877 [Acetivibrio straminisolvens JCM 21531]